MGRKIQVLAFILIVEVVFSHSRNLDFRLNNELRTATVAGDVNLTTAPYLVFLQHYVNGALGRIANPFFFLASGFLLFTGWEYTLAASWKKLRRRFMSIYVPYVTWCFIGMCSYYLAFYLVPNIPRIISGQMLQFLSPLDIAMMVFRMPSPYTLWFMRDLSILMLCSPLLLLLLPRLRGWAIGLFLLFFFTELEVPWVDRLGLTFFGIGCTLGVIGPKLERPLPGKPLYWLVSWLGFAFVYTILSLFTTMNLQVIWKLNIILGVLALWRLSDAIPERVWAALVGPAHYRFFIFVGHEPVLTIFKSGFFTSFGMSQASCLAAYLLLPVASCLVCYGTAVWLKAHLTRVYDFLSGGR